jgi:hypothetical protein
MPLSWIECSQMRRSCACAIAWPSAIATGSTTSSETPAVTTVAIRVGRSRNQRFDSKRFNSGPGDRDHAGPRDGGKKIADHPQREHQQRRIQHDAGDLLCARPRGDVV